MGKVYSYIETQIAVKYKTELGDSGEFRNKDIKGIVESHVADYCEEHKIDVSDVKVVHIHKE